MVNIAASELRSFTKELFVSAGTSAEHAQTMAELLVRGLRHSDTRALSVPASTSASASASASTSLQYSCCVVFSNASCVLTCMLCVGRWNKTWRKVTRRRATALGV